MLPQNKPDRIRILFDDDRLVANAGLILPATLALRPVPADEGGARHARRGEGAGLAEGRAERDGGAGRWWAWAWQ